MQVTINDVRKAVFLALDTAFPDVPAGGEEIKQELAPPYFFVQLLAPAHTQELGRRYLRDHPFVIWYFAPGRENKAMYDMAESLTATLAQVMVAGRPCRGYGMRFEIVEETLHFFVTYRFFVWEADVPGPTMQSLNERVTIINEG